MKKSIVRLILFFSLFFIFMSILTTNETFARNFYKEEVIIETPIEENILKEVEEVKESGISINLENVKTNYKKGENLDLSNLKVFLNFDDGTSKSINDFLVKGNDLSTYGEKKILVKYKEFEKSFNITVSYNLEDVEDYIMYSTTSLNLRIGPGVEFEKEISIPINTEVLVLRIVDNGWYNIKYKDKEYFCSSKYLSKEKTNTFLDNFDFNSSIMVIEGNISNDCLNKAIELYTKIPQNVINAMNNNGYKIMLSTNSNYTQGHAGMYWPIEMNHYKYAAIYATSVKKVNMAVIHECGHFIDNYLGRNENWGYSPNYWYKAVTSDPTWVQIYNEEVVASGFPSWANNCPEEYFAECVWKVLTIPFWCQKTIPKSYEYVLNCINRC